MSKTVQGWLVEVKASPEKLSHWLQRQYIGECLAADRMEKLAPQVEVPRHKHILSIIAEDERNHAQWVKRLLEARDLVLPEPSYDGDRYWSKVLGPNMSLSQLYAAGAHAEQMRLHRIEALANDQEIDQDISDTFRRILPDEAFHAKAFAHMAGADAMAAATEAHQQGLEALGLEL